MKKENNRVVAVSLTGVTGDGTKRRRKQTDDNTDVSLQPPWTDDKHHVSVQLPSMFGMCIPPAQSLPYASKK